MRLICIPVVLACFAAPLVAGEYNQVLSIGDKAPAWKDLPGVDGKRHSLADLKDKKLVVVVFTCNSCPIAEDYEDRTIAFAKKYADDVAVVAINVNKIPEDSLQEMQQRAREKKFQHAYLFDETQQIAKDYGAINTPEWFLLSPDRKIVYVGSMDDNSDPAKVKQHYLEAAVAAAIKGETPAVKETYANGCSIRFERKRRSRQPQPRSEI